jgi:gamma-carbonic anhydrase
VVDYGSMLVPYRELKPVIAPDVFVADSARVIGDTRLGAGASIWFGAVLRGDINYVSVGKRSNIQDNSVLHVGDNHPCIIKDHVLVGHQATIHGCTIHNGCLIGIGAIILNGAVIGKESLVAAGALIPEGMKVPPRSLVLGTPARVKRKVKKAELEDIRYWVQRYYALGQIYRKEAIAREKGYA